MLDRLEYRTRHAERLWYGFSRGGLPKQGESTRFPSPMCQSEQAEETASHVIAYCSRFTAQRRDLACPAGRVDVRTLCGHSKRGKAAGTLVPGAANPAKIPHGGGVAT